MTAIASDIYSIDDLEEHTKENQALFTCGCAQIYVYFSYNAGGGRGDQ